MQKEENEKLDSKQIDVQPHAKVRSRRARQLAEERAKTRFIGVVKKKNQEFKSKTKTKEQNLKRGKTSFSYEIGSQ